MNVFLPLYRMKINLIDLSFPFAFLIYVLCSFAKETKSSLSCFSDPCLHGICVDFLNSSYGCYCEDGYTGYQCQTNWNECWSQPCQNGATCMDLVARFDCLCLPGFTGRLCSHQINECLSNPCLHNGTCVDRLNYYECLCIPGYEGVNCEIDVSICNFTSFLPEPKCQNNGVCVDGPGLSFKCLCLPGWQGKTCNIDRNECEDPVCQNGGICINIPGDFLCACQYGNTGKFCEEEVNFCSINYCENDALCVMEDGNATCYCVPDFHGPHCQYKYDDCLPYSPRCLNGGTCIDGVDSFQCSCPNYSSGILCECLSSFYGVTCSELPPWFDSEKYIPFIVDIQPVKNISSIFLESSTRIFGDRKPLRTLTVLTDYLSYTEKIFERESYMQSSTVMEAKPASLISYLYPSDISSTEVIKKVIFKNITRHIPFISLPMSESSSISVWKSLRTSFTVTATDLSMPLNITLTYLPSVFSSKQLYITKLMPSSSKPSLDSSLTTISTSQKYHFNGYSNYEVSSISGIYVTSSTEKSISSVIYKHQTDEISSKFTKLFETSVRDISSKLFSSTKTKFVNLSIFFLSSEELLEYSNFSFKTVESQGETKFYTTEYSTAYLSSSIKFRFKEISDSKSDFEPFISSNEKSEKPAELKTLGTDSVTLKKSIIEILLSLQVYSTAFTTTYSEFPLTKMNETYYMSATERGKLLSSTVSEVSFTETSTVIDLMQTKHLSQKPELQTSFSDFSATELLTYFDDSLKSTPSIYSYKKGEKDLHDRTAIQEDRFISKSEILKPKTDVDLKSNVTRIISVESASDFFKSTITNGKIYSDVIKTSLRTDQGFHASITDSLLISSRKVVSSEKVKGRTLIMSTFQVPLSVAKTEAPSFTFDILTGSSFPRTIKEEKIFVGITPTLSSLDKVYILIYDKFSSQYSEERASKTTHMLVSSSKEITEGQSFICSFICNNGGTCVPSGTSISGGQCKCLFNYTGEYCEIYRYINKAYFTGSSYLKTRIQDLSLREEVKIYIQVSSESPNGLIAYSEGNGDSFFMILLRNSLLQFVFSCGLQTVSFLQGNRKLITHSKTDILIRLWWTPYLTFAPFGRGKCRASLQVNESIPVYSEQESALSDVKLGSIYLGGLPTNYISPLVVKAGFLPRLRGCISLLEVNEEEYDVWLVSTDGEEVEECGSKLCPTNACHNGGSCIPGIAEWKCVCPDSYTGKFCERKICDPNPCKSGMCLKSSDKEGTSLCMCPAELSGPICSKPQNSEDGRQFFYAGSLEGHSSYTNHLISFDHRKTFSIRLHFTTEHIDQLGLLLYLGNEVTSVKKDFFALALVRGYLMLTWDLGAGPRRIFSKEPLDSSFHTHFVKAGRTLKAGWMEVNTQSNVSSYAPGYLSSHDTNGILYLGGHPTWNFTLLPVDLNRLEGFYGCIFDVRVAKNLGGPWLKPKLLKSHGVGQCGKDVCADNQCQNGAVCQPTGSTYRCICRTGWRGVFCTYKSHYCGKSTFLKCAPGSTCIYFNETSEIFKCLCPFGKTGMICDQDMMISDPQFIGEDSYINLYVGNSLRKYSSVSIEFNPRSTDGILFLALPHFSEGDYLALLLKNSTLTLTYKLGKGHKNVISITSPKEVIIGEWQEVSLNRNGKYAILTFREEESSNIKRENILFSHALNNDDIFSKSEFLDVQTNIFLGGGPVEDIIPYQIFHEKKIPSFKGCMRKVIIGDVKYELSNIEKQNGILSGQGIDDCDGTPCGINVCANNGKCILTHKSARPFKCNCTQEFMGTRCEIPRVCFKHKCQNGGKCAILANRQHLGTNSKVLSPNLINPPYVCLCPPSKFGVFCEEDSRTTSANFRGRSFAIVEQGRFLAYNNPLKDIITLNFSTNSSEGIIIWKGNVNNSGKDYIGLGIRNGRLKLVWHLGGEYIGIIWPKDFVSDKKWHSVSVYRKEKTSTMYLDGKTYKKSTNGEFVQLNTPNIYYIGGFPNENSVRFTSDFHFTRTFIGCLKDVVLHPLSETLMFSSVSQGQDLQPCSQK